MGFARYLLYIYTDRNAKVFAIFQRGEKVYSLIGKYSNMEILAKENSSKPEAGIDITGDGIHGLVIEIFSGGAHL